MLYNAIIRIYYNPKQILPQLQDYNKLMPCDLLFISFHLQVNPLFIQDHFGIGIEQLLHISLFNRVFFLLFFKELLFCF